MMAIRIELEQSSITFKLLKDEQLFDMQKSIYYHDLDGVLTPLEVSAIKKKGYVIREGVEIYGELLTGLITTLDKLLKKNKIRPNTLKTYKIQGNLGPDSTSYKIASAFVQALRVDF